MKTLSLILGASFLLFGTVVSHAANLNRISTETEIPVATLQSERASTGLGWGGLEKAHLLANASGQSFDNIVAMHKNGEGWGKIAHDNGLNLGKIVSGAHHSGNAMSHAHNAHNQKVHGKSARNMNKGHGGNMNSMRGANHGSSFRSAHTGFNGMHGMSGMNHGMSDMGHGGHGR
jgi:hypothetical protein